MLTDIHPKETFELFNTPIVQQTAFWSQVKNQLGFQSIAINFKIKKSDIFNDESKEYIDSDILIILQQIDSKHTVAYIPYGPELEPNEELQGEFLEELSECIRPYLPSNCILIRYDLNWLSYWAKNEEDFDENGIWKGPPEVRMQELRFNFSTQNWNFKKAPSNILPSNTIYVDLKKDNQQLLDSMKPKTRYNIGLSERKGVNVKSIGLENIDVWYQLYRETALRNNLNIGDIKNFQAVLNAQLNNDNDTTEVLLLIAEFDSTPLAAMFLVISKNRASYLYGASSSSNRNLMATYALQWEAMQIAKSKGCTEYDMFGVSPNPTPSHPLYGLYKFKTGFGGELYHGIGCWDYPLDSQAYQYFCSLELSSQGYHVN